MCPNEKIMDFFYYYIKLTFSSPLGAVLEYERIKSPTLLVLKYQISNKEKR